MHGRWQFSLTDDKCKYYDSMIKDGFNTQSRGVCPQRSYYNKPSLRRLALSTQPNN